MPKRKSHSGACAFLCLVSAVSAAHAGDSTPQAGAVEARAKHFALAVSSGNPEVLKRLVSDDFDPRMQQIPMSAHMAVLMSFWDRSRGLAFDHATLLGPDSGRVVFKNHLTGGSTLIFLRVEPDPPYRIVALNTLSNLHDPISEPRQPGVAARNSNKMKIARELSAFMTRLSSANVFSGAVLLAKDGKVVFKGVYGQADRNSGVANRIDTKFNLGSMNKMFTAVAIAQLVERGQLSYDDPLSKFLADFPDAQSAKKIQIKHLLSHTAGLGMWWGPRYRQAAKDSFRTVDEMLAWASEDEKSTQFEPGTQFRYSNTGFIVLGKVIEKITGQSYYDYIRQNIYTPAGMDNTDSYELDAVTPRIAMGYEKTFDERGKATFRNNLYVTPVRGGPAGGGYSTVEDLLKFAEALRSGGLLKPENVQLLFSAKPALGASRYGYGFDVDEALGIVGHGGGGMGTSDNLDMFLHSGWTAIVLSNYTEVSGEVCEPVVTRIRELVD
jgi:CubicO group peptidase (beta-lactamase class C family)